MNTKTKIAVTSGLFLFLMVGITIVSKNPPARAEQPQNKEIDIDSISLNQLKADLAVELQTYKQVQRKKDAVLITLTKQNENLVKEINLIKTTIVPKDTIVTIKIELLDTVIVESKKKKGFLKKLIEKF